MEPILIDCSLTGGRGPAKKALELTRDLRLHQVPYLLLTDRGFELKLRDLGLDTDYVVDTRLNEDPRIILNKFFEIVRDIDYSFMVKLGARVAGPSASRNLGKPYYIVDGGLPDYMSDEDDLYNRETFQGAEKYLVTTQFEWKYPRRVDLDNVEVCCYPISRKTFEHIEKIKLHSKLENLDLIKGNLDGNLPRENDELLIDLVITGDYLNPENRVTYGAWLTTRQYDQSVGFIRRFFTDLGETFEKSFLFMDLELRRILADLIDEYRNVNVITYRNEWDFSTELIMKAVSDVTISRATNYQPYIAALAKGCNVTTPVPADGYMDEDAAAIQYSDMGLTKLICYDDEQYIYKFKDFLDDRAEQERIHQNLKDNDFIVNNNLNKIIIEIFKSNYRS